MNKIITVIAIIAVVFTVGMIMFYPQASDKFYQNKVEEISETTGIKYIGTIDTTDGIYDQLKNKLNSDDLELSFVGEYGNYDLYKITSEKADYLALFY